MRPAGEVRKMNNGTKIRATSSKVNNKSGLKMTAYFPDDINNRALDKSEDGSYINDSFEKSEHFDLKMQVQSNTDQI
jgi:hypothetical protein